MNFTTEQSKSTLDYYKILCNMSTHVDFEVLKKRLKMINIGLKYDLKEGYFNDLNKDYQFNELQFYPICLVTGLSIYNVNSYFYKNDLTYMTKKANEFKLLKNNYFCIIKGYIANL